jgi:DNA modification methylase
MTVRLLEGDCRAILPTLPEASVHCVVTSPPYWGLRDYGTATWEGGDAVLDPFAGSGTVGEVAERHGRHSVLVELSPAYVRLAEARTAQLGLFAQGAPA